MNVRDVVSAIGAWKWSIVKATAVSAVAVIGYFTGVYVKLERGMEIISSEMIQPAVAFEHADDVLRPSDAFRSQFLGQFAQVYFDWSDELPLPFAAKDSVSGSPTVRLTWKGVATNRSRTDPLFISTVDVRVTHRESTPFPWAELPVTPQLDLSADLGTFWVTHIELGPALDVQWEISTRALGPLAAERWERLYHDTRRVRFSSTDPCRPAEYGRWPVAADKSLARPLFLRVPPRAPGPGFFEHDGQWYEEVRSLARLSEETVTSSGDSLRFRVDYESLVGESGSVMTAVEIPDTVVLFEWDTERLRGDDPRLPLDCTYMVASPGPWGPGDFLLAVIPDRFTGLGDLSRPTGVDVLVERFQADVGGLPRGQSRHSGSTPDVFLNPRGALSVSVDIDAPVNGVYEIELFVNGEPVERTTLETLVPPQDALRFDTDHIPWFKAGSEP